VAEPAIFCSFLNVCSDPDIAVFQRQRVESVVGLSLVRDRANSVLDPTRGSRVFIEARYASRFLGSDSLIQFAKGTAEIAAFHPLGRHTTFAWRVRGGGIISPSLGFSGQSVRFIPPSERFYAGGASSVRGYGQNELGPVVRVVNPDRPETTTVRTPDGRDSTVIGGDTVTTAKGGNSLVIANAELRFPLPGFAGRLSGALFVDVGQLFERHGELVDFSRTRITPGAGIRIATPLGPMRLDVAFNGYAPERGELYVKQGTGLQLVNPDFPQNAPARNRLQVHFSVGQPF
jgi:outer membrane protein assembly factor BamA